MLHHENAKTLTISMGLAGWGTSSHNTSINVNKINILYEYDGRAYRQKYRQFL